MSIQRAQRHFFIKHFGVLMASVNWQSVQQFMNGSFVFLQTLVGAQGQWLEGKLFQRVASFNGPLIHS